MKRYSAILFFFLFAAAAMGQTQFKTIVPQTPIVVGDAFQVQYVIDDGEAATGFITPVFKGFKTVAGPYIYSGKSRLANNDRQSKNYVFTLVASPCRPPANIKMWPLAITRSRSSSMIWNQFSPGSRAKSKCMAWRKLWNGPGDLVKRNIWLSPRPYRGASVSRRVNTTKMTTLRRRKLFGQKDRTILKGKRVS